MDSVPILLSNKRIYLGSRGIPYSNRSVLNTLDVHLPNPELSLGDSPSYIHGGAWRDPEIDSTSILPALAFMDPERHPIAGVASINYRLSPYGSHPTQPSSPNDPSRNVMHPTHVEDVLTAIKWLQRKYRFGERYVLAGHSCGATLAFQAVMGQWPASADLVGTDAVMPQPMGIIGLAGIYDLVLLASTFKDVPVYREFLEGAFGKDQTEWRKASPVYGEYERTWPNGKALILGWSEDDTLIDVEQIRRMTTTMLQHKPAGRVDYHRRMKGKHDDLWQQGAELAGAIKLALSILKGEAS